MTLPRPSPACEAPASKSLLDQLATPTGPAYNAPNIVEQPHGVAERGHCGYGTAPTAPVESQKGMAMAFLTFLVNKHPTPPASISVGQPLSNSISGVALR